MKQSLLICLCVIFANRCALAAHPEVLVTPEERAAIQSKLDRAPWARTAYAALKARVDPYVQRTAKDPQFMSSRLFMNWETHYITPLVQNSRSVGGDGKAPLPTPRFGGARDWASKYQAPGHIEDLKPFNDQDGKVWLFNKETQKEEWADPGLTGRLFETTNEHIMQSAADAAFVYWLTGDEAYARYGADILWTYMNGFSYMQPPRIPDGSRGMAGIIGFDSFEVIHEDIVTPLSVTYDFLYDYLRTHGKDVTLIQNQLKRMGDRVIAGGSRDGNWNLNQARIIAYGGLALEDNDAYADHKGRPYYVDVVLNADLPNQNGITHVIHEGYDPTTALWPEAPGYGFGTTKDMVLLASLVGSEPAGRALLADPLLPKALFAQAQLTFPNGWSVGLGDTDNTRINTTAAELLIAAARARHDGVLEQQLTPILQREIAAGYYDRPAQSNLVALCRYVDELHTDASATAAELARTYWGKPLNILMQRNPGADPAHSLGAALYGTDGGHIHANGMAIELYGAGAILGADPGRGASYWQPDHAQYYSQPPAHNTVIVNARSSYPISRQGRIAMQPAILEPALDQPAVSSNFGFAQGTFHYNNPAADQQRTLALIRTSPTAGFYLDIFRSRAASADNSFHDYLYHNVGQLRSVTDVANTPLSLAASDLLTSKLGCMTGYDYFKNEKSIESAADAHAFFAAKSRDGTDRIMSLWMLGQPGRRIFTADAPPDHAAREAMPEFSTTPMPALIVRQTGDAWDHPFVAAYEPYLQSDGPTIHSLRPAKVDGNSAGLVACAIETGNSTIYVEQEPAAPQPRKIEGYTFNAAFAAIAVANNAIAEIYLGRGRSAGNESIFVTADSDTAASLARESDGWRYSSTSPLTAGLVFDLPPNATAKSWTISCIGSPAPVPFKQTASTANQLVGTCALPPGFNQHLRITPSP